MPALLPDRFVMAILAMLLLGWLLPISGNVQNMVQNVIFGAIFLLFFLHGLRLPRGDLIKAAQNWRLQGAILLFIFAAMPLAGWGLARLADGALPAALLAGVIFAAILPSTVQSAISYSSVSGGNIGASVIAAALSNLCAIAITPLLAAALLGAVGVTMDGGIVMKIAGMLLLPFALGQLAQKALHRWAMRQKSLLSLFDKAIILAAVYASFAAAVGSGQLSQIDMQAMIALVLLLLILLIFAFTMAMLLGALLPFDRADRISLLFAGAHKSIATGAPMAAILFGDAAGLIILPAILYHIAQLVISAPLSARLARD